MKIYHGSINIIEKPIYVYGKPNNDYGLGFYCTETLELAKEWSVDYELDGYANCYELDLTDLKILNLNKKPYGVLLWLALLTKTVSLTNLKRIRINCGLSQKELATITSIPLRTVQQYEQKQNNINKAQANYILSLAQALNCSPKELLE